MFFILISTFLFLIPYFKFFSPGLVFSTNLFYAVHGFASVLNNICECTFLPLLFPDPQVKTWG
jgi:hypothetical protein